MQQQQQQHKIEKGEVLQLTTQYLDITFLSREQRCVLASSPGFLRRHCRRQHERPGSCSASRGLVVRYNISHLPLRCSATIPLLSVIYTYAYDQK
ncbi:unnamed protein product [Trichogramma brassicae]|uniref:Uncharacterized protein n=1 Tax=Trichogramma brassicae TaxID=86971 RepID=A0A6H5IFK8_9HYME|nr:unnamed protein product [Trichogramma brassicae]